jgi:hypothetical protein
MTTVFCFIAACVSFQMTAAAQTAFRLSDLSWMAGCWESRDGGQRLISEQWMQPAGGLMLGMGRTVERDKAVDFEMMRIEQNGADVVFYARPRANKEETAFKMIKGGDGEAVFENKSHDFPQRVIYRRNGDKLLASIEGDQKGKLVVIGFPMVRAKCDTLQPAMKVAGAARRIHHS